MQERNENYEEIEIVERLKEWDNRYREQTFTFQEEYIKAGFAEKVFE